MSNTLQPKPSRGANPNPRAGPSHPLSRHLINLAIPRGECHVRKQSSPRTGVHSWSLHHAQSQPENMNTCQIKTSSRTSWSKLTKANFDASRTSKSNPAALPSQSKQRYDSTTGYDLRRDPALTVKPGQTWSNLVKPQKTNPLPAVTAQNHRFSPSRLPWMALNPCKLLHTSRSAFCPLQFAFRCGWLRLIAADCG
jgi:hypothetical protein